MDAPFDVIAGEGNRSEPRLRPEDMRVIEGGAADEADQTVDEADKGVQYEVIAGEGNRSEPRLRPEDMQVIEGGTGDLEHKREILFKRPWELSSLTEVRYLCGVFKLPPLKCIALMLVYVDYHSQTDHEKAECYRALIEDIVPPHVIRRHRMVMATLGVYG